MVLKVGDEVSAIEATYRRETGNFDFRPKVFDVITKSWTLLDTGSCVSCSPVQPGDVEDPNYKLRAVNGETIYQDSARHSPISSGEHLLKRT